MGRTEFWFLIIAVFILFVLIMIALARISILEDLCLDILCFFESLSNEKEIQQNNDDDSEQ